MFETLSIDALEILRWVIFAFFVASAVAVTLGVFWENEDNEKPARHKGWLVLVWALGAEIVLTIGVFVVDGVISQRQKAEIISLQERTAPRRLTITQCKEIVDSLSDFSGRKVRVATYVTDGEGSTLGQMIVVCLRAAKIDVEAGMATILPWRGFFSGVTVSGSDTKLVEATSAALRDKGGLIVVPGITGIFPGNEAIGVDTPSAKAALIVVGVKPVEEIKFK